MVIVVTLSVNNTNAQSSRKTEQLVKEDIPIGGNAQSKLEVNEDIYDKGKMQSMATRMMPHLKKERT